MTSDRFFFVVGCVLAGDLVVYLEDTSLQLEKSAQDADSSGAVGSETIPSTHSLFNI
jgi:hypothetical protein